MTKDRGERLTEVSYSGAPLRLLLIEPEPRAALWIAELVRACWDEPLVIAHAERVADALDDLTAAPAGCLLVDLAGAPDDWLTVLEQLRTVAAESAIVVLGTGGDEAAELAALRAGAQDYVAKAQLSPARLRRTLKQAIERRRAEMALTHRALHDSLTGLPNRALFMDRLGVALDRARRSDARVAVLFLDVDNFKDINDRRGHAAGDRMLVELAERLRRMLRPMDTVARFGGDEFTFLFEDLADEREMLLIAERIARATEFPVAVGDGDALATVSLGITIVDDPRTPPENVIREADAAMYRAKERGGGRFELYDENTRERALERLELEIGLRRALAEGQLRVHYQPIYSLGETTTLVGFEALLRWQHPERGLIEAHEFIGPAEETSLIVELGHFVLAEVIRALLSWRVQRPDVTIAVNLSLRELEDVGLPARIAAALRESGLDPGALCLEIAEGSVVRNMSSAGRALRTLKGLGVRTAVDDFGIGASSIPALRSLSLDAVKIHHSLLAELGSAGTPLVGAVVGLAHALGLRVVAEGVETETQAAHLRALGCDNAQGFLFERPLAEEDVHSLLGRTDGGELLLQR